MANADAFQAGFGIGKQDSLKGKKDGERAGLFTKTASPSSFKKGGKVRKTGLALVHKGEVVLTKEQAKGGKKKATRKRLGSKG